MVDVATAGVATEVWCPRWRPTPGDAPALTIPAGAARRRLGEDDRALLPLPPDRFPPAPTHPAPVQQAQLAAWWASYGARYAKARWKLRGLQRIGEWPT